MPNIKKKISEAEDWLDLSDPEVLPLKVIAKDSFIFTLLGSVMVFLSFALAVWFSQK